MNHAGGLGSSPPGNRAVGTMASQEQISDSTFTTVQQMQSSRQVLKHKTELDCLKVIAGRQNV